MKHLELRDTFLVGHAQIDAEHAHIIDLLNACIDIANADGDRDSFCAAFEAVEVALITHVEHEEAIMRKLGFTEGDEAIHEQGRKLFRELAHDCRTTVAMHDILRQASGFLLEMILKSDLAFKSYLQHIDYAEADPT